MQPGTGFCKTASTRSSGFPKLYVYRAVQHHFATAPVTDISDVSGKNVYWVKGIVHATGNDRKIVIQSVNVNLVVEYGEEWMADELRNSRMIFIGKNLQPAGFEQMLKQCLQ
ncbi:MAG: GTP-binding protein [Janthinobacterium lividum]